VFQIDLKHVNQNFNSNNVELGIDLREYYPSVEWDILGVPAERHEKYYPCCTEPYPGECNECDGRTVLVSLRDGLDTMTKTEYPCHSSWPSRSPVTIPASLSQARPLFGNAACQLTVPKLCHYLHVQVLQDCKLHVRCTLRAVLPITLNPHSVVASKYPYVLDNI
jgi:hypothetical protein